MQTAPLRAELETVSRQQKLDSDHRDGLQARQTEIENRLKALEESEAGLQERKKKVEAWISETQAKVRSQRVCRGKTNNLTVQIDELKGRDKEVKKETQQLTDRQAKISAEVEQVQDKLAEMKSDRRDVRCRVLRFAPRLSKARFID